VTAWTSSSLPRNEDEGVVLEEEGEVSQGWDESINSPSFDELLTEERPNRRKREKNGLETEKIECEGEGRRLEFTKPYENSFHH